MDNDSAARRIRIGHAERDAVIEQLRVAAGEGRLEVEELTDRMEAAAAAKTFGDLDPLVEDLPVPPPSQSLGGHSGAVVRAASGGLVPAGDGPGWDPADPLVIRASWEDERRRGRWIVPPHIRVETPGATAELNFLEVDQFPQRISIEVRGAVGACVLVVPEGWGADISRLEGAWGSKKSQVDEVPRDGFPQVVVHGALGMSSVTVRHANWFDRRRVERRD